MDSTGVDQSNGRLLKHEYEASASQNENHLSILVVINCNTTVCTTVNFQHRKHHAKIHTFIYKIHILKQTCIYLFFLILLLGQLETKE